MIRVSRGIIRRTNRFIMHNVLHADDPPHRLALGAAVGVFVTFTPTVGIQTLLVLLIAWLVRANKAVAVPVVWLSNPATIMPIFYPSYLVGRVLLRQPKFDAAWWSELSAPPAGWSDASSFYWTKLMEVAPSLWIGSLVVATLVATATYYVCYYLIRMYRLRRWGQLTPPKAKLRPDRRAA